MLILSLDTATETRSAAILRDLQLVAEIVCLSKNQCHSSALLSDIDALLGIAGVTMKSVDLLAVTTGPGSFTGLRTGLATVKAFSVTLGIPAIGVPTLYAIAYSAQVVGCVGALIPAGRGEVFAEFLNVSEKGIQSLTGPQHVPPSEAFQIATTLSTEIIWAGPVARQLSSALSDFAVSRGIYWNEGEEGSKDIKKMWYLARYTEQLSVYAGALALRQFLTGAITRAGELCPIYVRASDAELKQRTSV